MRTSERQSGSDTKFYQPGGAVLVSAWIALVSLNCGGGSAPTAPQSPTPAPTPTPQAVPAEAFGGFWQEDIDSKYKVTVAGPTDVTIEGLGWLRGLDEFSSIRIERDTLHFRQTLSGTTLWFDCRLTIDATRDRLAGPCTDAWGNSATKSWARIEAQPEPGPTLPPSAYDGTWVGRSSNLPGGNVKTLYFTVANGVVTRLWGDVHTWTPCDWAVNTAPNVPLTLDRYTYRFKASLDAKGITAEVEGTFDATAADSGGGSVVVNKAGYACGSNLIFDTDRTYSIQTTRQ